MAEIPAYSEWRQHTASMVPDQYVLKVGMALVNYDRAETVDNRRALSTNFDAWYANQSKELRDRIRDRQEGPVSALYESLREMQAADALADAQAGAIKDLLHGRSLQFKPATLGGLVQSTGEKFEKFQNRASAASSAYGQVNNAIALGQQFKSGTGLLPSIVKADSGNSTPYLTGLAESGASKLGSAIHIQRLTRYLATICEGVDPEVVLGALGLVSVANFAASVTPLIGVISSGGQALVGWGTFFKSAYDRRTIRNNRDAVRPGDAAAALDAVIDLLGDEISSEGKAAVSSTLAFGGKALATFLDAGVASGAIIGSLELLGGVFSAIHQYAASKKEMDAANELLKDGKNLNLDIFNASPILGCYFFVVSDHSTIMNIAVNDYGAPNFKEGAEDMRKRIDTALDRARQLILLSDLEIAGLANHKGVVEQNYSKKTGIAKIAATPDAIMSGIVDRFKRIFNRFVA